MNILLTNDDGVFAPGLAALIEPLGELGRVTVVAPHSEQSGVGHALTYREDIRPERVCLNGSTQGYALTGTPADCVKLGLLSLVGERLDLVVSGINVGLNMGLNVFYSGTVSAAMEGAMHGIPAVAFSTDPANGERLELAARHAVATLKLILGKGRPGGVAFNVNIPSCGEAMPEVLFTHHKTEPFPERYVEQETPCGRSYRLDVAREALDSEPERCDVRAVHRGMISVTPLRASLTDADSLRRFA